MNLSLSSLEGITLTETTPATTLTKKDYSNSFINSNYTNEFNQNLIQNIGDEPTTAEKIAYGLDKQNMFFGNVFRVAKAGFKLPLTLNKEFKEVALENAKRKSRIISTT